VHIKAEFHCTKTQCSYRTMSSLTQTFLVSPGIQYEYHYVPPSSQSETFLFLHGFPSSIHSWRHQIDYFSAQGYGCLTPNLMGYGKTYSPRDFHEYKIKQMVLHLLALMSHLKIDQPVHVVGHDFGTFPASRLALYEPTRVRSLVLLSIGYTPPGSMDLDKRIESTLDIGVSLVWTMEPLLCSRKTFRV
jgi:soluble epoxide hydrolase / lipid-phosphate phosphatase